MCREWQERPDEGMRKMKRLSADVGNKQRNCRHFYTQRADKYIYLFIRKYISYLCL